MLVQDKYQYQGKVKGRGVYIFKKNKLNVLCILWGDRDGCKKNNR